MQNPWEIVFKGSLIGVEKHSPKGFERAVRPPGVRLILTNAEGKILITKEFRSEHDKYDYRLPGGKVFDDLESWLDVRENEEAMGKAILAAGTLEAKQEAGIDRIDDLSVIYKSAAGASVIWDLHYLTGKIKEIGEQELDGDEKEHGIEVGFYSKDEVLAMLKSSLISEDRTVAVLLRYLLN